MVANVAINHHCHPETEPRGFSPSVFVSVTLRPGPLRREPRIPPVLRRDVRRDCRRRALASLPDQPGHCHDARHARHARTRRANHVVSYRREQDAEMVRRMVRARYDQRAEQIHDVAPEIVQHRQTHGAAQSDRPRPDVIHGQTNRHSRDCHDQQTADGQRQNAAHGLRVVRKYARHDHQNHDAVPHRD